MADNDMKAPDSDERTPPSADELAQAIEMQRQQLKQIHALVHSQANLLNETYRFEVGEADLGYCCDVVRDMLERINATLGSLVVELKSRRPLAPIALAHSIETPRQELFRAQAVAEAVENLMRTHEFEQGEADLRTAMVTVVRMMDDVLTAIEPMTLGLPIPLP